MIRMRGIRGMIGKLPWTVLLLVGCALVLVAFAVPIGAVPFQEAAKAPTQLILGDEQFDAYLPLLEGDRVALFTNQSGIVGDVVYTLAKEEEGIDQTLVPFGFDARGEEVTYGQHILDALLERGVNVTAVFSPEHGFRGTEDAGARVDSMVDEKTGVPILSLYSNGSHFPAPEDMDRFDTLVIDMQDVGLRYYTYHIAMYYLLDACAGAGKKVILLDRPNPNGFYVDGPILQEKYISGVGVLPLPVVYGMTWGELARMIVGEGWLTQGEDVDLTIIPCQNYTHQTKTSLIKRPSPNLKDMRAVYLYASTCFFENTAFSVGRGTSFPFEIFGSPYLGGLEEVPFSFTPQSMEGALNPPFQGEVCYGYDLRDTPIEEIWEEGINLSYLIWAHDALQEAAPGVSFWGNVSEDGSYWVDLLSGTDTLRHQIDEGWSEDQIKASWQEGLDAFREQRRPYLLYKE